jgi:hypothetical protein
MPLCSPPKPPRPPRPARLACPNPPPAAAISIVDGSGAIAVVVHVKDRGNFSELSRRETLPPPSKSFNLAAVRSVVWPWLVEVLFAVDDFRNMGKSGVFTMIARLSRGYRLSREVLTSGREERKVVLPERPEKSMLCGRDHLVSTEISCVGE